MDASIGTWRYAISTQTVLSSDVLSRFKTSWRDHFDKEQAHQALSSACDEVIFANERGEIVEGCRSNVFILRNGVYLTPPLSAGALDGRLRREMLDNGTAREATLTVADLRDGEVYFGNSLRGLIAGVMNQKAC
jgi:branched-subunit amino acid aminotransferase/4-amino-4-deoxychorismate lyase